MDRPLWITSVVSLVAFGGIGLYLLLSAWSDYRGYTNDHDSDSPSSYDHNEFKAEMITKILGGLGLVALGTYCFFYPSLTF